MFELSNSNYRGSKQQQHSNSEVGFLIFTVSKNNKSYLIYDLNFSIYFPTRANILMLLIVAVVI